ncbi:MAG: glycosyltransferase family 4 protein [Isosphaeraceae bacterium]
MRRVAMILPGLGRVQRGAETAFLEVARALRRDPGVEVELFGSGRDVPDGLAIRGVECTPRERFERWPRFPTLRSENHYEELSFVLSLARNHAYHPEDFDAVVSCSYPWLNWYLRLAGGRRRSRGPKQIFVTQNGDWACRAEGREFRFFGCDGLICINPEYYNRHRGRYVSALIPNGVDASVYRPAAEADGDAWDDPRVPSSGRVVLMVSALIPPKRVSDAVRAVARVEDGFLLVAGDGREREAVAALAAELLPGRHLLLGSLPRAIMPGLYRRADAFLHMHHEEPFGIAYLEAGATGLPVVAPDAAVPRWILGEHARYADPGNPEAVASALREALDPATGPAMGAGLRRRVLDGWTWDVQAARYRDFIDRVVSGREGERN